MNHIGMKYSLVTRNIIADSIEAVAMATPFDAIVFMPSCDKVVPGMLIAAARLNIPSIFVSGGAMLAGVYKGKKIGLSNVFEAVGAYNTGQITKRELNSVEEMACPTCGSCSETLVAGPSSIVRSRVPIRLRTSDPRYGWALDSLLPKRIFLRESARQPATDPWSLIQPCRPSSPEWAPLARSLAFPEDQRPPHRVRPSAPS